MSLSPRLMPPQLLSPRLAQPPNHSSYLVRVFRGAHFYLGENGLAHGHVMKLHKYTPRPESNLFFLFITGQEAAMESAAFAFPFFPPVLELKGCGSGCFYSGDSVLIQFRAG